MLIDPRIKDIKSKADITKFPQFKMFLETHCTYSFQVFKCNDSSCRHVS